MDYEAPESAARPGRPLVQALTLALIAFLAGLAAMAWLLVHWTAGARLIGVVPQPPPQQQVQPVAAPLSQPVTQAPPPPIDTPAPAGSEGQLGRRLAQVEQRLATIDVQSRTAVGDAGRAEALLVAFAARRAVERGVQLGYIEPLLRQRFSTAQPQAVATVLTFAHDPVTLQQLQTGFQDMKPHLMGGGPEQSWWRAFRTELGGLITIRREGTPSTMPSDRLRRAERALDGGQVEVALLEVLRLPGRENAEEWIGKARRYVAVRQALDTIETAALLEQRPPQPPQLSTVAASAAVPAHR